MEITITNRAGQITLDKDLLREIISQSMNHFSLSEEQATALVTSIIDAQLTYSDNFVDLEDVLCGTLDFFEIYEGNLQEVSRAEQSETAPF